MSSVSMLAGADSAAVRHGCLHGMHVLRESVVAGPCAFVKSNYDLCHMQKVLPEVYFSLLSGWVFIFLHCSEGLAAALHSLQLYTGLLK